MLAIGLCRPREVHPVGLSLGAGLYPVVRSAILRTRPAPIDLGVPVVSAPSGPAVTARPSAPAVTARPSAHPAQVRVRLGRPAA